MKVRYYGHVGARTGYGVAAREMCRALLTAGVELEICSFERVDADVLDGARHSLLLAPHVRAMADLTEPDVCIVHTLPLDCTKALAHAIRDGMDHDMPWVAYTTWEGYSHVPEAMREELSIFDAVWTPSKYAADRIATGWDLEAQMPKIGESPIVVMPHAYDVDYEWTFDDVTRDPSAPYRFLYVGAWTSRKNPQGLIRAFAHANFADHEADLWIHSAGTPMETFAVAHAQTGCHAKMARVRFLNDQLSSHLLHKQYRQVDCFVTASRGEAWNLPAFEAMLHRRHVIAPSPAGSDDFLKWTSAMLVEEGMEMPCAVDVKVTGASPNGKPRGLNLEIIGAQGITSRSTWWEPDLVELSMAMRRSVANMQRDLIVDYDVAARFSYEAVGKLAFKHLEEM